MHTSKYDKFHAVLIGGEDFSRVDDLAMHQEGQDRRHRHKCPQHRAVSLVWATTTLPAGTSSAEEQIVTAHRYGRLTVLALHLPLA